MCFESYCSVVSCVHNLICVGAPGGPPPPPPIPGAPGAPPPPPMMGGMPFGKQRAVVKSNVPLPMLNWVVLRNVENTIFTVSGSKLIVSLVEVQVNIRLFIIFACSSLCILFFPAPS